MKAIVKSEGFKPITIEVTIESEDELLTLWHRMNIGWVKGQGPSTMGYPSKEPRMPDHMGTIAHAFFSTLDSLVHPT